ncbi:FGGY-family carbohydrate kinase [Bradyrhizobium sp. STM 3557]|uniref:FGGY-family carbohydrate kinase n=1 Tax=Bradyrhizobium sp. STM 3557 TaxID=578920 RepID=UPI0038904FC4
MSDLVLGIDIGTSGVRIAAIDHAARLVALATAATPAAHRDGQRITQDASIWVRGLDEAMARLGSMIDRSRVGALAVDGTSGTLVGIDDHGVPVTAGSLYNDRADDADIDAVERVAPPQAAVHGATSPLARAMRLLRTPGIARVLHQADWIAAQFTGRFDVSDESNALKTGYDPVSRRWPDWVAATNVETTKLPAVVPAGSVIGHVSAEASRRFGLSAQTVVVAGMTDGCAAFMATGATKPGDAVTSLGSTLVLKLASEVPLFAPEYGIYSHRIGDLWLTGGASNTGGAALAQFFSSEQLRVLSARIDPSVSTGLDYYPLPAPGERFPVNDPALAPRLMPRPDDDVVFLQGLFEGIARIEALGYRRLSELGGTSLARVVSVGGGAANEVWRRIRAAALGVPVMASANDEAAVGVARLALGPGSSS